MSESVTPPPARDELEYGAPSRSLIRCGVSDSNPEGLAILLRRAIIGIAQHRAGDGEPMEDYTDVYIEGQKERWLVCLPVRTVLRWYWVTAPD